jgi:hypothetical protein
MCNYKFVFSIDAGKADILKVTFKQIENSFVRYFVGTSLADVKGKDLASPLGKTIRISYPNSLYISFEQLQEGDMTQFEVEYLYID